MRQFWGYRRPDGRVGVRNHVLILPVSLCASDTTRIIASQVEGAVTFSNHNGCSQVPPDQEMTVDVEAGFAANPNVYGTIAISLGCENCRLEIVEQAIRARTNKPLVCIKIQDEGGTHATIERATREARRMVQQASMLQKELCDVSELIIGTECGGSDPTSGLGANPLVGAACDLHVAAGGTAVLSETTEFIGAEHILARRAATPAVRERIYEIVYRYEEALRRVGAEVRQGNPSPGNMAGGLTTLEEKSLGCIHKGGHTPVNAVYDYAKQMKAREGLVIMDTPGNDPSSVAGMVAGGAQIVLFTTGLGTPTGNPVAPVIKLSANRETCRTMADNIDFDASPAIYGGCTMDELADSLMDDIIATANGRLTSAEALGYTETTIARLCNYV